MTNPSDTADVDQTALDDCAHALERVRANMEAVGKYNEWRAAVNCEFLLLLSELDDKGRTRIMDFTKESLETLDGLRRAAMQ